LRSYLQIKLLLEDTQDGRDKPRYSHIALVAKQINMLN